MEVIPKSDIYQDKSHDNLDHRRMLRLGQILDDYTVRSQIDFAPKVATYQANKKANASITSSEVYKTALRYGIITGIILGCVIGGIFLIISR